MSYIKWILFSFTFIFILTACNPPVYHQTETNVATVKQRIDETQQQSDAAKNPDPSLVVDQGYYVDQTPISLVKQPLWLKNHVTIHGESLPFSFFSKAIVKDNKNSIVTRYQTSLYPALAIPSLDYSGDIKGALDLLAAKSGYVYSIRGNEVYWQAFITKTFDIAFMPGASDYMMGNSGGSGSISGASSGGSSTTTTNTIIDDSASSQYSSLKGSLSVWDDLKNTITQLLSSEGKVVISQATTTVTVRDRPSNVELVSKYIHNLNHSLSQQVLIKVQILDVTLESDFNYGINWETVQKRLKGYEFSLIANYGTPVAITPFSSASAPNIGIAPKAGIANVGTGVNALINALSQQGKVSIVTEPRVVCLNNQVSAIRIVNQEGYLASIQTTALPAGGTSASTTTVTSQVTPGTLVTGLTLYILPKIMNNKIYLQVNADLSTSQGFKSISSTGTASTSTSATPAPTIQVPTNVTQKQFNQRSVIGSGDTLILSGFKQVSNTANAQQLLTSQSLGGKASTQVDSETIVLITPIILHGSA